MSEPESPLPTEPGDDAPRRLAWWWWAAGAAVIVLAIVVAILLTRGGDNDSTATGTASTATVRESIDPSKGSPPDPSTSPTADDAETDATTPTSEAPGPEPSQTVPVDGEGTPEAGVTAEVEKIEAVEGTAEIPGEVGGPSLRVTVQVTNGTGSELDLSLAVLNLYYGAAMTPALPLGQPGVVPFPASVDAGESAAGTYVFNVPEDERDDITIELDLSVDSTVILFRGPAGV